jgi:hypothetical protein
MFAKFLFSLGVAVLVLWALGYSPSRMKERASAWSSSTAGTLTGSNSDWGSATY